MLKLDPEFPHGFLVFDAESVHSLVSAINALHFVGFWDDGTDSILLHSVYIIVLKSLHRFCGKAGRLA